MTSPTCHIQERAYTDGWRAAQRGEILRNIGVTNHFRLGYRDYHNSPTRTKERARELTERQTA